MTYFRIGDIFTNKEKEEKDMSPDYSVIGRRIKQARIEQNMTQENLADIIDVSIAFLIRFMYYK